MRKIKLALTNYIHENSLEFFPEFIETVDEYVPQENEAQCYEQVAVFTAEEIKKIIKGLQEIQISQERLAILKERIAKIALIDQKLMRKISSDMSMRENTEVTNLYFVYYLTQLSRFNGFLNKIKMLDARGESNDASLSETFSPILNPYLLHQDQITLEVNTGKIPGTFRPAHVYGKPETGKNATQYFYDPKSTPIGKPHQDEKKFQEANKKIGAATQLSNAANALKFFAQQFPGAHAGQERDDYFKPADVKAHDIDQSLFRVARQKIANGLKLTKEENKVAFEGKYYRIQAPVKFEHKNVESAKKTIVSHVGHASEVITLQGNIPLCVNTDPVHKHTFTGNANIKEKLIATGAKIAYGRQTDPAFGTDEYPAINVVLITHNHHDHMCCESLIEAYANNPGTLFIVPVGDMKVAKSFHLKNVIEFASWDDYADIKLSDSKGNTADYRISAFPAKHASARTLADDTCHSLYMGYMMQNLAEKEVVLCTGDTAVLDETHFNDLKYYLLENDLTLSIAAIAHGPDRPRSHMEITHQSTADAVAMHARFNVMNLKVMQARKNTDDNALQILNAVACRGIGYHQGCYRLGLLSLNDVPSTLLRMMAVLETVKTIELSALVHSECVHRVKATDLLKDNLHYTFLDDFEKQGLLDTIYAYLAADISGMNAGDVNTLIQSHLAIPAPGYRTDLSLSKPNNGFSFNYEQLIVNRDPDDFSSEPKQAYEYFARHISRDMYENFIAQSASPQAIMTFFKNAFQSYDARKISPAAMNDKVRDARKFCQTLDNFSLQVPSEALTVEQVKNCISDNLKLLAKKYFLSKNESIRDESHFHTLIVLLSGLLYDLPGFRDQFQKRQIDFQVREQCNPDAGKTCARP